MQACLPSSSDRCFRFSAPSSTLPLVSALGLVVATFVGFALPAAQASNNSASFRTPLTSTGGDPDARGMASGSFSEKRSSFIVTASRLEPNLPFEVFIGGQLRHSGLTSRSGGLVARFASEPSRGVVRLDFDPRGKTIEVLLNSNPVLTGVFSGQGEAAQSSGMESVNLRKVSAGSRAQATARHSRSQNGQSSFSVSLRRIPVGPTTLLINGQPVGAAQTPNPAGNLNFVFREAPTPKKLSPTLPDPRGAQIDLVQGDLVLFSGEMRARGQGANFAARSSFRSLIPSSLNPPVGSAEARYSTDERARRVFDVEIEDVSLGTYELRVNGISRGSILVRETDDGLEGEIEFQTHDLDPNELPLNFDPVGATLSILNPDGLTVFSGVFDPTQANTSPSGGSPIQFAEKMASTGADPDASGQARYEIDSSGAHYFEVEIEDVPSGNYPILVGGTQRAVLQAFLQGDTIEGEVEFRAPGERGKVTMNFDPRGQVLEILNASGLALFRHNFGSGSAPDAGPVEQPLFLRTALFASPGAQGSVRATLEIDREGDTELELEAHDLPLGSYSVSIGGVERGTLVVRVVGDRNEGEIEFDTDPDPQDVLLDFPVLDQPITISSGTTVLFSRTLSRP